MGRAWLGGVALATRRGTMSPHAFRVGLASAAVAPEGPAIASIRSHAAAARALLDELDRATEPAFAEQLAEELERLGARLIEVAHALGSAAAPSAG